MRRVPARMVQIVEHHDDGATLRAIELLEQVEHLDLMGDVQECGGLVEEHERRVLGQRHGDPGALPLASRQLVDASVLQLDEIGELERPADCLRVAGGPLREEALMGVATPPYQVLDDEAIGCPGRLRQQTQPCSDGSRRPASDISAVEIHRPLARPQQACQRTQQRRLADAFGPTMAVISPCGMTVVRPVRISGPP